MALPRPAIVAALALTLFAAGCGEVSTDQPGIAPGSSTVTSHEPADPPATVGEAATWQLQQPEFVNPHAQGLMVEVTRLGCSGGETGEVLEPQVAYDNDRIIIRTDVAPLTGDTYTCQGNDAVPVEIQLEQSIGGRDLVDAACLEGEAVTTADCTDAVRWTSPSRGATSEIPDWEPPADYSFVVTSGCGERAFIGRFAVTVTAGAVSAVEPIGESYAGVTAEMTPTLSDMLDEARAAAEQGTVEVAVDDAGVPRWIDIDPIPNAIDDESCYAISDYRQL
ncbi:MAG: hypothetical protein GX555_14685 [Actinomycetales bacterium]|nr:hypothetical protein [Actinomycetales bacterium]